MRVITALNVNEAFAKGIKLLRKEQELNPLATQDSRAGKVVVAPCPVTSEYINPRERVLFDPVRDANPFFHLFESLWMLAGRNDATWLDTFVKDFSKRYAETNGRLHGAYGHRWRHHFSKVGEEDFGFDQIEEAKGLLAADLNNRRVVIQMWNPEVDLGAHKKDIPCNLCVVPRIRTENQAPPDADYKATRQVLDITVMCRSNDAIWGAYGANAVHFSMLQEYLANKLSVDVGRYYQISNNFHAYVSVLDKQPVWIDGDFIDDPYRAAPTSSTGDRFTSIYGGVRPVKPMSFGDPKDFDKDLYKFMGLDPGNHLLTYNTEFFAHVVQPMYRAHYWHRRKMYASALEELESMPKDNDWRGAASLWLKRRFNNLKIVIG